MATSPVRYAVVGLGHIAQAAVLPAFTHARANSRLVALVSGDRDKRLKLSRRYEVPAYDYEQYPDLLRSGSIDAVYISLPNELHHAYAIPAAKAGIHVLCEKPLTVTSAQALGMVEAAKKSKVVLMTAYRLHFERTNLMAIQIANSGQLGRLRFFNSIFSLPVATGNIRTKEELGGGSVYDLGIYCLNAARYLFRAEPTEVFAASVTQTDKRFTQVDEMTSVIMRFPDDRLATFTSSLGASDTGNYTIVGTRGSLRVDPSFSHAGELRLHLTIDSKTKSLTFPRRDQFAPEIIYFSNCVRRRRQPEPSGLEGLIDVRIIEAIYKSARTRRWVTLLRQHTRGDTYPTLQQEIRIPRVRKPDLVEARSSRGDK